MNDEPVRPNSVEARVAVLEEQIRAFNLRLTSVSDRAYGLTGTITGVVSALDEAREQRTALIEKIEDVQENVQRLSDSSLRTGVEMAFHVKRCETRAARLEKLTWGALAALLAVLGFLAQDYFTRMHH